MTDVTFVRPGRWGLSRPLQEADGGWTTYAAQQRLAPKVECYWPPIRNGAPVIDAVLVRLGGVITAPSDNNTRLFPADTTLADTTLGDLTPAQRSALRNSLDEWLVGYAYEDFDGTPKIVAAFAVSTVNYTEQTTLRAVVRDIYRHLAHTSSRARLALRETHNTEYLDDFSTDPASRWTGVSGGAYTWDSVNSEMDVDVVQTRAAMRYSANDPGSIEHEAQATFLYTDVGGPGCGGGGGRIDNAGADDFYFPVLAPSGEVFMYRHAAGVRTLLATWTGYTHASSDWITARSAYAGTAGANVVIDFWLQDHGTSKPSDPGWIGVDNTPDDTFTDSSVDRLDASGHIQCGIVWHGQGTDHDSRHSYFKQRAISDRTGGGGGGLSGRMSLLGVGH